MEVAQGDVTVNVVHDVHETQDMRDTLSDTGH